jgi:MFS family permease
MVVRGFQGFANSFIGTSIYSMTTIEFPENREKYIGYVELALGLGLMLGPVLGSVFMNMTDGDFEVTFYIFAFLIACGGMFAFFALPNYLNRDNGEPTGISARASIVSIGVHAIERKENESSEDDESTRDPNGKRKKVKRVSFGMFLKHTRSLFCLIACGASMICLLFFESTLAKYLFDNFAISPKENGLIFAIPCLFYAGSSPFVSLLTKRMQRRLIIFLAFMLNVVALFMMGPSYILDFPSTLKDHAEWLVFTGLALNGVSISFIFVPLLPEILYVVSTEEGLDNSNELNDKASGIYNVAYASGTILAPNIGGLLSDAYGFRVMCDCLAIFSATFSIIFLFANVGIRTLCDIKPDPRLEEPHHKKKGSVRDSVAVDKNPLLTSEGGFLDKAKQGNINKSELTNTQVDKTDYANANTKYAN